MNPIHTLLVDTRITEVLINNHKDIYFETQGQLHRLQDGFDSSLIYHNYIYDLLKKSEQNIDYDHPFCSFELDRNRYQIISPIITKKDYALSIRKHFHSQFELKNFTQDLSRIETLKKILLEKKNFIVIGTTGSGKTSLLNSLLNALLPHERVIILEDTPELLTKNPSHLHLYTRPPQNLSEINLTHLIRESLRLRPDRIVVGEVRGPEAKELLLALSTGHLGSFGSLHAASPHEALMRLEMLIQLGAPQWSLETIRKMIFFGLQFIIHIQKNSNGLRQIHSITQITGLESTGFLIEEVQENEKFF